MKQTNWNLPPLLILLLVGFMALQTGLALRAQRVAGAGFEAQWGHYIPVAKYEDDGRINVYAAAGYLNNRQDRFWSLINIGGPFIHLAKPVFWLADSLGLIRIYQDSDTYLVYPQEYHRLWKLFGLYKAWFWMIWLLPGIWWVLSRHQSIQAAWLGVLLTALLPFVVTFAVRLKADLPAIIVGVYAVLLLLESLKRRKFSWLLGCAVMLGFSFSIKMNVLPLGLGLIWGLGRLHQNWKQTIGRAALLGGALLGAFFISNFNAVYGVITFVQGLMAHNLAPLDSSRSLLESISSFVQAQVYRMLRLDALLGRPLNLFYLPVLGAASWVAWRRGTDFLRLMVGFQWLYFVYMLLIMQERLEVLTYYYYGTAIFAIFLFSWALDSLLLALKKQSLNSQRAGVFLTSLLILATGWEQFQIARYLFGPTNRDLAVEWLDQKATATSRIGIPMPQGGSFVTPWIRLDPFRHRLEQIGGNAELLEEKRPDLVLWVKYSPESASFSNANYQLVQRFNAGADLPHERYDLYQEEQYEIYQRLQPPEDRISDGEIYYQTNRLPLMEGDRLLHYQAWSMNIMHTSFYQKTKTGLHFSEHSVMPPYLGRQTINAALYAQPMQLETPLLTFWGVRGVVGVDRNGFKASLLEHQDAPFEPIMTQPSLYSIQGDEILMGQVKHPFGPAVVIHWIKHERSDSAVPLAIPTEELYHENHWALIGLTVKAGTQGGVVNVLGGKHLAGLIVRPGESQLRFPFEIKPGGSARFELLGEEVEILDQEVGLLEAKVIPREQIRLNPWGADIKVTLEASGEVSLALPFHDQWEVSVNQQETQYQMGPGGMISIPLDAGTYEIKVRYCGYEELFLAPQRAQPK
ncbi:MAG: glycosyltransferase family 39 protein [bacterium]|nr:glycosyltransferase family 39 protein [bacterium]